MRKPIAALVHGLALLLVYRWTHSVSGWLVTGGGLMLLIDRYALRAAPWPRFAWSRELALRAATFLAGGAAFYLMRPGLVSLSEAAYRGVMVSLTAALLEQALRLARHCGLDRLQAGVCACGVLVLLVPVIAGLHPLHTVPKRTPAAWGFAYEDVRFRAADGVELAGWLVPHAQARGNVIFCHGHGRNRGHVAGHLQTLHDQGLNVLTFDFRGHGESDGHTSTFGRREVRDLEAAVAYLSERCPDQPLILIGISLGASVCLQALPNLPEVRGVWSEGAFAHLTSPVNQELSFLPDAVRQPLLASYYVLGWLDCGVWAPAVNPIEHLDRVRAPIFFCHGTDDELTPITDGHALYAAYAGPKEYWWVEGASHYYVRQRNREEYLGRLGAFIESCLHRQARR
jgi:alpha-beta hydrolase superfamily lysophospholipase